MARVPKAQVTTPPAWLHEPAVEVAPRKTKPGGSVLVRTTFVAASKPELVTLSERVMGCRTTAGLGAAKPVTARSGAAPTAVVVDEILLAGKRSSALPLTVAKLVSAPPAR